MAKNDRVWNIILIISLILIVHGMTQTGSEDKKAAQAGQSEVAVGSTTGALSFIMKKQVLLTGAMVWVMVAAGGLFLAPTILRGWKNLFFPPTVPSWIMIVGLGMLFMVIRGRK